LLTQIITKSNYFNKLDTSCPQIVATTDMTPGGSQEVIRNFNVKNIVNVTDDPKILTMSHVDIFL